MKIRRKSASSPADDQVSEGVSGEASGDASATTAAAAPGQGPFDEAEVAGDGVQRVDLGSLLVPPMEERELRLQVDEQTNAVRAVILAGPDGALEFQAFAAPRNGDLWSTVRPQIAQDLVNRGGVAEEREGRWGTELVCQMPVTRPDGTQAVQPSRIIGVNGERWLLRASLLGRPAMEPDAAGDWEDTLAQIVVRRGNVAMPVGEPLAVTLPDDARRLG